MGDGKMLGNDKARKQPGAFGLEHQAFHGAALNVDGFLCV
jgi:hypothetical protein